MDVGLGHRHRAELGCRGLADEDEAGASQTRNDAVVGGSQKALERPGAHAQEGAAHRIEILDGDRDTVERGMRGRPCSIGLASGVAGLIGHDVDERVELAVLFRDASQIELGQFLGRQEARANHFALLEGRHPKNFRFVHRPTLTSILAHVEDAPSAGKWGKNGLEGRCRPVILTFVQ